MDLIHILKNYKKLVITNNNIHHVFMKVVVKMLIVVVLCVQSTVVVKVNVKRKLRDVIANSVDMMKRNINFNVLVSIQDLNVIQLYANVQIAIMLIY